MEGHWNNRKMIDDWYRLGFVIPQGDQFLEVEAEAPYIFVASPEMDFASVLDGATEVRAVSFEVITGATPVTLRATPPTGPFTLISPNEVKLEARPAPQTAAFLIQYNPETTGDEGDFAVYGPDRSWTVTLRVRHTSYA